MKIAWISGWAVPPVWLEQAAHKAFPAHTHHAVAPTLQAARALTLPAAGFDVFAGYSLGALLWLTAEAALPPGKKALLFAPIFAFCAEKHKGGQTRRAQVLFLKKWLRRDKRAALRDFYARTGLPDFSKDPSLDTEALIDGLTLLETLEAAPGPSARFLGYAGGADPLTDAPALQTLWPSVTIFPQATHAVDTLWSALNRDVFADDGLL